VSARGRGSPALPSGLIAGSLVAGGLGATLLVHALPGVTALDRVRGSLFPGLAGIGRSEHVALTFDDGPGPRSTPRILEALDVLGWRATFFMLGTMVRRSPTVAREVAAAGHEIALHGDEHRNLLKLGPVATLREVRRGFEAVSDAAGCRPRWFRPPYGALTTPTLLATSRLGLRPVLWTACAGDWSAEATPDSIAAVVRAGLHPGGTLLLHDASRDPTSDAWRATLGALPLLAAHFEAVGLAVGPLAEHGIGPQVLRSG
jgi:peptidoglycan/xylan/chitin deacetylase (PgdA/CDA1 family)